MHNHWGRNEISPEYSGKKQRRLRNDSIREQLLVLAVKGAMQKRLLKWCGHVCRMEDHCEPRYFMEARPTGKRPRERPRRKLCGQIGTNKRKVILRDEGTRRDRDGWLSWLEASPRLKAQWR